jgi:hypothetical protein
MNSECLQRLLDKLHSELTYLPMGSLITP